MKLRIRETDDLEQVKALDLQCFPSDTREDFSDQEMWLATLDEEPIGFTAYKLENGVPHITRMGVVPQARGMRLQVRLADVCCRAARRRGFEAVKTYVRADNLPSLKNLLRAHFSPVKTWVDANGAWFINLERKLLTAK
jgi:ribosomal protein S18 acetylase RimI-like enzyme